MILDYNSDNIFKKIIHGKISCKKVSIDGIICEDLHTLAFYDINPVKNIHILLIPKGEYVNVCDFFENATNAEIYSFQCMLVKILKHCQNGKIIGNFGAYQEVMHFHMHILSDDWM